MSYTKANYPTFETDVLIKSAEQSCAFTGFVDKNIKFIEGFRLADAELWQRFVTQFKLHSDDGDFGWRGEYWGKMMRGASFVCEYTGNEKLYGVLTETVKDMLTAEDENGRISTYSQDKEFHGWDIWSRKYVLLGMQYFIEICKDEKLAEKAVGCMCRQADYLISKIGEGDGKIPITSASHNWRGMNSASLLEPIVRLYNLTQDKKYLDFASYIVGTGATDIENIFELAYENNFYPYQYPVTKAYEMTSCFEGLLEYYRATKIEKYRTAVINYANKLLESDFTVIGSSGCTYEQFDHSTVRQANTNNPKIMQETCVTVTIMKFCRQLNMLTGDSRFADAFECSMYNGYFGAINTEYAVEPTLKIRHPDVKVEPLPFDSYSPLTAGTRGNGIGGFRIMPDNHYFGCCACIGSAGAGLIPKLAVALCREGIVQNLYIAGKEKIKLQSGNTVSLDIVTEYPRMGEVEITLKCEKPEKFTLMLRNPAWSKATSVSVDGEAVKCAEGYIKIARDWSENTVFLSLDMTTRAEKPIAYGHDILMNKTVSKYDYTVPRYDVEDPAAKNHICLRRGPVTLAAETRLGIDLDKPLPIKVNSDGSCNSTLPEKDIAPYEHTVEIEVPLTDGGTVHLTDYASAGKLWDERARLAAWIRTQ